MTVIELRSSSVARHTRFEDLLLAAASSAAVVIEARVARRSARVESPVGHAFADADRSALAGAHAHGMLPR